MYIPKHFHEKDSERILALIEANSFGMLVTAPDDVPFVSHLPFIFDHASGSQGKLLGHLARENPQWQHFSSGDEVLAVFQGPHAYVSPSWYSSSGVPTWNYAVVHLRGKPQLIKSESELESLVERLTHIYESRQVNPWKPNLSGERRTKLLNMIVGFEVEITDVQAKFKLSQNRPLHDQQNVIKQLRQSSDQTEGTVAKLMSDGLRDHF